MSLLAINRLGGSAFDCAALWLSMQMPKETYTHTHPCGNAVLGDAITPTWLTRHCSNATAQQTTHTAHSTSHHSIEQHSRPLTFSSPLTSTRTFGLPCLSTMSYDISFLSR